MSVETIRFYQRKGLLTKPEKPHGGIRHYGCADVARLEFIKSAKRLGFSLDEIAQLLSLEDGTGCEEAARIAAQRLEDIRMRLQDLSRIESTLAALLQECRSRHDELSCPLIAALEERGSR